MIVTDKTRAAISALLKIAREERAALTEDLADIARARAAAETSLKALAPESGPINCEGALARRRKLAVMLMTFEQAEEDAQEKLEEANLASARLEAVIARTLNAGGEAGPAARSA